MRQLTDDVTGLEGLGVVDVLMTTPAAHASSGSDSVVAAADPTGRTGRSFGPSTVCARLRLLHSFSAYRGKRVYKMSYEGWAQCEEKNERVKGRGGDYRVLHLLLLLAVVFLLVLVLPPDAHTVVCCIVRVVKFLRLPI